MRTVLAPHTGSAGARALAEALDVYRLREFGSRFRPRSSDLIVNWGRSDLPEFPVGRVLNHPDAVAVCAHKLASFHAFREHEVPTVKWTTSPAESGQWFREGNIVIARHDLTGRGGSGIGVLDPEHNPEAFLNAPAAPLYTQYFKRKAEYRVHVFDGRVIAVQQKRLANGTEKHRHTYIVRSHANGWRFTRQGVEAPECVLNASLAAVRSLGLDFGGVDVGYNEHHGVAAVFEVNSAPGIEGTTVEDYAQAIRGI